MRMALILEIQLRAAFQPLGDEDEQMRGEWAVTRCAEAIDRVGHPSLSSLSIYQDDIVLYLSMAKTTSSYANLNT